jgi:hypothetical protein
MDFFDKGGAKQADCVLKNKLLEDYKEHNNDNLPAENKTYH